MVSVWRFTADRGLCFREQPVNRLIWQGQRVLMSLLRAYLLSRHVAKLLTGIKS